MGLLHTKPCSTHSTHLRSYEIPETLVDLCIDRLFSSISLRQCPRFLCRWYNDHERSCSQRLPCPRSIVPDGTASRKDPDGFHLAIQRSNDRSRTSSIALPITVGSRSMKTARGTYLPVPKRAHQTMPIFIPLKESRHQTCFAKKCTKRRFFRV